MKNISTIFLIVSFIFIIIFSSCSQDDNSFAKEHAKYLPGEYTTWSIRMADSEMARLGDSLMYGGSNPNAKWEYSTGLFLKSLLDLWEATGEAKYFDYSKKVIDSFIEENGNIKTYKMKDYNLDKINSGKVLLLLYRITKDEKYKRASDTLYRQLQGQPRTSEGGFWHKKRYPWQMWLDGIYMSAPFYAQYGLMFDKPNAFDDAVKQITIIDMHTRDAQTGLRYHGWDESNKQAWANPVTGNSPNFWGRGMGWYSMALVDILDFIPVEYNGRSQIIYILKDLFKAISKYQDETGLWYQVVNLGDRTGNYLETSCSAMFVYSIAKALNKGYIEPSYRTVVVKGYDGLINHKVSEDKDNRVNLNGICSVAGLGGNPYRDGSFEYYISEPVVSNDLKGIAPFIMAGIQMEEMNPDETE
jgi:unsaturated rhamnogalacturonyl hydrolase